MGNKGSLKYLATVLSILTEKTHIHVVSRSIRLLSDIDGVVENNIIETPSSLKRRRVFTKEDGVNNYLQHLYNR